MNTKFKGTRGKWLMRLNQGKNRTRIEVNIQEFESRPDCLKNLYSYMLDDEQCDVKGCGCAHNGWHDALLISKAPEMLAMLEQIANGFDDSKKHLILKKVQKLIKEATEL